jgi:predicted nucleic-acid-binding Zn-ribbon protein
MIDYKKHFSTYACPKCKGRAIFFEEVYLRKNQWKFWRESLCLYVSVTCGLCGYTEMYSKKVLASIKEEVPAKETVQAIEKAD